MYEQPVISTAGYVDYTRVRKWKGFADRMRGVEGNFNGTAFKGNVFLGRKKTHIASSARRKETYEVVPSTFQVLSLLLSPSSERPAVEEAA